jgi:hypothetical protein
MSRPHRRLSTPGFVQLQSGETQKATTTGDLSADTFRPDLLFLGVPTHEDCDPPNSGCTESPSNSWLTRIGLPRRLCRRRVNLLAAPPLHAPRGIISLQTGVHPHHSRGTAWASASALPSLPQSVDEHRDDDHETDDNLLEVRRPAHLLRTVAQHGHYQRSNHRAENCPDSATQAGSTDDHGCYDVEFQPHCDGRIALT